jgi:hypothetical protein
VVRKFGDFAHRRVATERLKREAPLLWISAFDFDDRFVGMHVLDRPRSRPPSMMTRSPGFSIG